MVSEDPVLKKRKFNHNLSLSIISGASGSTNNQSLSDENKASIDLNSGPVGEIRVGRSYQAEIPSLISEFDKNSHPDDSRSVCVWSPEISTDDPEILEFVNVAQKKCNYTIEQALGLLKWHKGDVAKAKSDLANYLPYPDQWCPEDKILFEQAFSHHGKAFNRIKQVLPDKTTAQLVVHYYRWKKSRYRIGTRVDKSTDDESDSDSGDEMSTEYVKAMKCGNCGVSEPALHQLAPKGALCHQCFTHWRKTGKNRAVPNKVEETGKVRRCPRGIYLNQEGIDLICHNKGEADALVVKMTEQVASIKRQIQINRQVIFNLKAKNRAGIDKYRPSEESTSAAPRCRSRWTTDEILLSVQAFRRYGKNWAAISDVVGNKTEAHIKAFYQNYKDHYSLDKIIAEFEKESNLMESVIELDEKAEEASDSKAA